MKVNGYEIGQEPTSEEMQVYMRVKHFLNMEWIAQWLGSPEDYDEGELLTQDEFERLVWRFEDADFGAEETEYLHFEQRQIVEERRTA